MAFGFGKDENADRVEETKVYQLNRTIDIIGTIVTSLLYAGCAAALAVTAFIFRTPESYDSYVLLAPAAGFLAYTIHILRQDMPFNASVQISDIGITARAWFQPERFVPWSDITGVAWIGKREIGRQGIQWSHSLFLEVPALTYGRRRIRLGSSPSWVPTIGELRDEIINRCELKEVERIPFRWHPLRCWLYGTKRQVWRSEQLS